MKTILLLSVLSSACVLGGTQIAAPPQPTPLVTSCVGPDGASRCGATPKWNKTPSNLFRVTSGGDRAAATPPSWTVPLWVFDPANSTTCASDNNNCTQSACGVAGTFQGPCVTYGEVLARWGTSAPSLPQNTTIQQLSDDTLADPIVFRGTPTSSSFALYFVGTLLTQTWAGTTLGTVALKNRTQGTATVTTSALGATVAPIVGNWLTNTTRTASSWVYTSSGSTAYLSQPFPPNATPGTIPVNQNASEVNTYTSGDTYTVTLPTKARFLDLEPITNGSTVPAVVLMHVFDSFTGHTSTWNSYVIATESRFDAVINQNGSVQTNVGYNALYNDYVLGTNSSFDNETIVGGAIGMGGGCRITDSLLDGDVILSEKIRLVGTSTSSEISFGGMHIGRVFSMNTALSTSNVQMNGLLFTATGSGFANSGGVCVLSFADGATLEYFDTAAETFACNTTTWSLGASADTAACSVTIASPAVWNCGISLSVANLAAAAGASGFGNNAIDLLTGIHITNH